MKLRYIEKKSTVLSPSSLPCLARIPTINISAGCSHNCVYCYSKGYSNYPGDDALTIYGNLLEKLSSELKHKRKLPYAVYFCPSCDPFQPVKEVLDCSFEIMRLLLKQHICVQFVTKGIIPERFFELFSQTPALVSGQIGISCTDERILANLEPGAATISQRLSSLSTLSKLGIDVAVRADPLIYGVTDSDTQIQNLCSSISANTQKLAVSYLFLRPAIKKSIEEISNKSMSSQILESYRSICKLSIGTANSVGQVLPASIRNKSYDRIRKLAKQFRIDILICGCKNHDIVSETCRLSKDPGQIEQTMF